MSYGFGNTTKLILPLNSVGSFKSILNPPSPRAYSFCALDLFNYSWSVENSVLSLMVWEPSSASAAEFSSSISRSISFKSSAVCLTDNPSFLTYSACDYVVVVTVSVAPFFSSICTSSVFAYSLTTSSSFWSYYSVSCSYYYVGSAAGSS